MKKILETIQITEQQHEILRYSNYLKWCDSRAVSHTHLQLLLSTQKIWDWFCSEYQEKECQFLIDVHDYTHLSVIDLRK